METEKYRYRSGNTQSGTMRIDWDCMIKDILVHWWMIVLTAAGAALLTAAIVQFGYTPVYTSETTFVIGKSGFSYNAISTNLSQAETTTKQYTQVVSSSILQKQVCEDLKMSSFNASVNVETVPSSNLMVLRVSADTPRDAYLIGRSVIENAVDLMGYFMDGVTMQELQQAVIPEEVSNPLNLSGYMEKAALAGGILMILLLALLSYYKDTIKNPDDVSLKVDTRLLGTIYYEKKHKSVKSTGNHKKGSLLLNNPMLSFGYVEAYHMLATRIRIRMDKEEKKVLMVSSVSENEGKSTVAANLAVSLAQEGKRVLLMDCDFRKPAQYKIFETGSLGDKDLAETLRKKGNIRVGHVKNMPGLYTLFSEKASDKPWSREEFQYIEYILNNLKKKVDYVIIDTAPMALVSDTEEYAGLADAALLVIRQDVMEACYINDAIDDLEAAGIALIGCVLNGVHRGMIIRTQEYGHYSGSNYGKYSHYNKMREQGDN